MHVSSPHFLFSVVSRRLKPAERSRCDDKTPRYGYSICWHMSLFGGFYPMAVRPPRGLSLGHWRTSRITTLMLACLLGRDPQISNDAERTKHRCARMPEPINWNANSTVKPTPASQISIRISSKSSTFPGSTCPLTTRTTGLIQILNVRIPLFRSSSILDSKSSFKSLN